MRAPDVRPAYLIGRVDRIVRAELEVALADFELTIAEYTALSVLAARPGLSGARLARRSLVSPQAANKLVLALERRGLIERAGSADGGRTLHTMVTAEGAAVLAAADEAAKRTEQSVFSALGAADRRQLIELLRLVARVGSDDD